MIRPLLRGALPLLLALALTGCNDDGGTSNGGGTGDGDGPGGRYGKGGEYVALGDSYTAAPQTGPADGEDGCLRSTTNYPHLVAKATGMSLRDVSCAGARTAALSAPQRTAFAEVPAQLDALSEGTDLVTLRIGGNDGSVFAKLVGLCPRLGVTSPDGSQCERLLTNGRDLDAVVGDLEKALTAQLAAIEERAPEATVLVVGYPQVFPAGTTGCPELPMKGGTLRLAREVVEGFNTAMQRAATTAGVRYVDVYASTEGHDICGADPWIAGSPVRKSGGTGFHPYPEEARNVADLVLAELD